MSTLTEARHAVAGMLLGVVPADVAVYPSPPSSPSAPCLIVSVEDSEQTGPCMWSQTLRVTAIGPGGDNESALVWLEDLLLTCAAELTKQLCCPVEWDAPIAVSLGGQTYLSSSFDVVHDVSV